VPPAAAGSAVLLVAVPAGMAVPVLLSVVVAVLTAVVAASAGGRLPGSLVAAPPRRIVRP
jgi:hypothetical protein